jgi:TP901 family phage tail tape measure protein
MDITLIDQSVSPEAVKQLEDYKKVINETYESTKKLLAENLALRDSLQDISTYKELLGWIKKYAKLQEELLTVEGERAKMRTKAEAIIQREAAARSKEAVELEKLRQSYAKTKKELSNYVKESQAAEGSIAGMRAKLSKLTSEYDHLSGAVRNSKFGREAAKDIRALSDEIKELEAATGRNQRNVGNYFDAVKKGLAGIAGALGIVTGLRLLVGVFKDGYKTIVDFEQANANLASLMRKEIGEIKDLTEQAKELGRTTEYTASQVTALQSALATLGFKENQISDMAEPILKFATATGASLSEAAKLAGNTMRAFGLESEEITRVVSAMAVGTTKSALSFDYLQSAMSTLAPVARQYGFALEDTVALLGTLSNVGFNASSAATATRNILLNLADTSGKLAVELGRPVKNLDDLSVALKELDGRGIDLAETLELTDKRSVAAFNAFIRGADSLVELRDGITDVGDQLDKMHKTRLNTVEGATKLLESAWEGLILSFSGSTGIFKSVIDSLTKLVEVIKALVNFLSKHAAAVKATTVAVIAYIAAVKLSVLWTKNGASATALLTAGIKKVTQAFKALTAAIKANPIGLLFSAIAGVVTYLISFNKESRVAAKATAEFNIELKKERKEIGDLFGALKKAKEGTEERTKAIGRINEKYGQYLPNLLTEKSTLEEIEKAQRKVTEEMAKSVAFKSQQSALEELHNNVLKAAETFSEKLDKVTKDMTYEQQGRFKALVEGIKQQIENGLPIQEVSEKIRSAFIEAGGDWDKALKLDGLTNSFESLLNKEAELNSETVRLKESMDAYLEALGLVSKSDAGGLGSTAESVTKVGERIEWLRGEIEKTKTSLKDLRSNDKILDVKGIEETEKALKDLESELELLTGKQEKAKKVADDSAKITERMIKAQKDLYDLEISEQLKAFKAMADNEKNSYTTRMQASDDYYDGQMQALRDNQSYQLQMGKLLGDEQKLLIAQTDAKIEALDKERTKNRVKIAEDQSKKIIEAIKKEVDARKRQISMRENLEVADLSEEYAKGVIAREQYEKKRKEIAEKYAKETGEVEKKLALEYIDTLEEMIEAANLQGLDTSDLEKQVVELRDRIVQIGIEANEQVGNANKNMWDQLHKDMAEGLNMTEEQFKEFTGAIGGIFEGIGELVSIASQKRIDAYDAEIEKINERKDTELSALEDSAATEEFKEQEKARIEERAAAQTQALEEKKKQEQLKQARWEKAWSITSIAMNTAIAVMKQFATTPYPVAIPLVAAIIAQGAVQAAVVAATPVPAYEHGTEDHPGGPAKVGEKRSEAVILPGGSIWKTPAKTTYVDLPKHAVVKPDYNAFIAEQARDVIRMNREVERFEQVKSDKLLEEMKGLRHDLRAQKPASLHVSADAKGIWNIVQGDERHKKSLSKSLYT